jgi:hypothetical protein
MRIPLVTWLLLYCLFGQAQVDSTGRLTALSERDLNKLGSEYDRMAASVTQQSSSLLQSLQQKETRIYQQLAGKDSAAAATLLAGSKTFYQHIGSAVRPLKDYLPGADSVQTALQYLHLQGLSGSLPGSLQSVQGKLANLQGSLQQAGGLSALLQQRQQQLQTQLSSFGMPAALAGYEQKVYYYKAQVQQYKNLLHDPDQLAGKVLSVVRNSPSFQHYFINHSYLSSLFRMPGSDAETTAVAAAGLQTREQVNTLVTAKLGKGADFAGAVAGDNNGSSGGDNPLSGSMQQAQTELNNLKAKLSGGNGTAPASATGFTPNPQHTKTLFQRLRLGIDVQSQQSTSLLPALSTIGLSATYLLTDKSEAGLGAAYKAGWGEPFNHIAVSSQGAALRSHFNWQWKGSLWLSGGYEMNYLNAFAQLSQLRVISAWQPSALVGLMKKYKAGKWNAQMQLLFDALYRQHIPQSQPVLFRLGYTL